MDQWFYAKGNRQFGPVGTAELRQLLEQGELAPTELVWQKGMKSWTPASAVPALCEGLSISVPPTEPPRTAPPVAAPAAVPGPVKAEEEPRPAGRSVQTFERSAAAFQRSREGDTRHLFDYLLDAARAHLGWAFLDATARLFALLGHYLLYAAMAAVLVFHVTAGARTGSFDYVVLGLGAVAGLALLQYAAGRFFGALDRLGRTGGGTIASSALLDCFALLAALLGFVALVGWTLRAVEAERYDLVLPALAAFVIAQYAAIAALNPDALRIAIAGEVSVTEEALGTLAFFAKLVLRLAPAAFALGVLAGAVEMVRAVLLLIADEERLLDSLVLGDLSLGLLVLAAILPPLAYLGYLPIQLGIDLVRALLEKRPPTSDS